MKILVINGPNLNMLGKRDQGHYGNLSLDKIETLLKDEFKEITFEFYQSNIEGEIITKVQGAENNYSGIMINPGAYAHTSVGIRDALADCKIPKVELHLSHLANREEFRQNLVTATACDGYISGFKENSYLAGAYLMIKLLK
jgi:3-dehydroquinate dehydratase II